MSKGIPEELRNFLASLLVGGDAKTQRDLLTAHECVDQQFVNALGQWIANQARAADPPLTVGTILSSLALTLACEIHRHCRSEREVCAASQLYGEYIHDIAHAIAKTNPFPDVEK